MHAHRALVARSLDYLPRLKLEGAGSDSSTKVNCHITPPTGLCASSTSGGSGRRVRPGTAVRRPILQGPHSSRRRARNAKAFPDNVAAFACPNERPRHDPAIPMSNRRFWRDRSRPCIAKPH